METQHMISRLAAVLLACTFAFAARAESYLWEIATFNNRLYLYGTVHAGKADWYPLDEAVEEAFKDSQILVVEADILDSAKLEKAARVGSLFPPDILAKHVSEKDYARFVKLLPRYGLTEEQVRQMKPFLAVSLLVFQEWARVGFVAPAGVDLYLLRKAKAEVRPVVEIEGIEVQTQLIDSLTEAENRLIFEGTLAALESGLTAEQIHGLVNAWRKGDPARLLEVAQKYNANVPGAREFEEKFVWARHESMVKKIEGYLSSRDRHFVAVGALHLAGPRGLVELLKKKGYVVKQR
jgi:uncharacterized protein YbaP (TraB family)